MGDRVLMQCWSSSTGAFGPVVYGHWAGGNAPAIVARLALRMATRPGDVQYASARLVQELCAATSDPNGSLSVGIWNTDHILAPDDSHGDAGCWLIDVSDNFSTKILGASGEQY